jgi:hypothetical protein
MRISVRENGLQEKRLTTVMFKSRRMRWTGYEISRGKKINAYRMLVGKSKGKRPLGRHR